MTMFRLAFLALVIPTATVAQQVVPTPTPSPSASAIPVPAAPRGLPTPAAPVVLPVPTPTSTSAATSVATPTTTPVARETPVSRRAPLPRPTASASPTPVPSAAPTPAPIAAAPSIAPTPQATPAPVVVAPADIGSGAPWLAIVVALAVAAAAIGVLLWRRSRAGNLERAPVFTADDEPGSAAVALPSAEPIPPVSAGIPVLAVEFRPVRAGVNLLSATVESEVIVTNTGEAPVEDVQVEIRMIGAHAGQDAELAAIAADPVTHPAMAPFALPSGQFVQLSAVAALPRASIVPLDAGGRPIFVPIVTVKVAAIAGGAPIRHTAAFAVGVERVDSARLAPFRLDGPPRTFDTVAARPHPVG